MENIVTISLAGSYSFHIERRAASLLDDYLTSLRKRIEDDEASQEIIQSIEERIVELFTEWSTDSAPITLAIVRRVMETIGSPEELYDDAKEEEVHRKKERNKQEEPDHTKPPRYTTRLYRDTQRRVFGGVCAGLAAHMNLPLWIPRLMFIILSLFYGVAILIYIVLWIAIPRARTRLQRMEMHGEPITFSSLEERIQREYQELRNNATLSGKSSLGAFFSSLAMLFATLALAILKYGIYIFGVLLILASFFSMVATFVTLFVPITWLDIWGKFLYEIPFLELMFSNNSILLPCLVALVGLILPFVGLCFGIYCLVRRALLLKLALIGFLCWAGALLGVTVLAGNTALQHAHYYSMEKNYPLPIQVGDTLVLSSIRGEMETRPPQKRSLFRLLSSREKGGRRTAAVCIEIRSSKDLKGRMVVEKESYGVPEPESIDLLTALDYPVHIDGTRLELPERYRLDGVADGVQRVSVRIYLPKNTYLRIDQPSLLKKLHWKNKSCRLDRKTNPIWYNSGTDFVPYQDEPFDSLIE